MRALASLLVLTSACAAALPTTAQPAAFIALSRDFADFTTWTHFDLPANGLATGIHGAGLQTVFINQLPPAGATAFPAGTVLVKRMTNGDPPIFAMVKRGGNFNAGGASGWEWFELQETQGEVSIVWRGEAPPDAGGDAYSAGITCNACHGVAAANDWVQSQPLQLHRAVTTADASP